MSLDILATHRDPTSPSAQSTDKRPVRITDTILRDAHQSLLATRMRTADMLPILERLDRVGYWSVEMWGGATFDAAMRFLREDPWERLRLIRRGMPNTRLQMLMRGQNILGYRHYPDDIVEHFVRKAADNGIDVFRIFDALNDTRNMETAIKAVLRAGKIAEGAISYTVSPFHTVERFVKVGQRLEELGCQVLCIKDMAGLLSPPVAFELVRQLKATVSIPIHVHSHSTSGMAEGAYLKAIEAGADIVDTAISAMAGGTSQPPTESMVAMLQGSPHDTGLDIGLLTEIDEYFRGVRKKYEHFESEFNGVDPRVLRFQIPGGMISNLANQLRDQGALDRMEEVLEEVPRVRAKTGYPPLVTPTSQIVGTQATLNVLMDEPYEAFNLETRNLLLGKYGRTPAPCDAELLSRAEDMAGAPAIQERPADRLEPMWEESKAAVAEFGGDLEEDALSYAMFPQVALKFFQERALPGLPPEVTAAAVSALIHQLRSKQVPQSQAQGPKASRWKLAGRLSAMRGRGL